MTHHHPAFRRIAPALALLFPALLPAPALAAEPAPGHGDDHHDHDQDIVVTGLRKAASDAVSGVTVLDGAALAGEVRASLGETLARQPGVSATSFGPAASRPILRGLGGERIRLLTDGVGSLDLSSSSGDHAVAINPLTADRIEILRGPGALLFGSSAIGGVVNVIDRRIPRRLPEAPFHAEGTAAYGSAADERSASLGIDAPLGGGFVLHADGNWSKSDDLDTGGHILVPALRQVVSASADPAVAALAGLKGRLPNTAARASEAAGGLAYVAGDLNLGISLARHDAKYGVPIRYALEAGGEAEAPTIDLRQTRIDGRAEIPLSGWLQNVSLRGNYVRYAHDEIEESGEIGSRFRARGGEARLDLAQAEKGGWGGTSGAQYMEKSVRIAGEEKYLPDARQRQFSLFTLQSLESGPWRFEGGLRFEHSRLTANEDDDLVTPARARSFDTVSASLGTVVDFAPGWKGALNLSRAVRAPALDELFAHGPHAGTQAYEIGEPDLSPERSHGVEFSLRHRAGPLRIDLSAFYARFSNFIYLFGDGTEQDDLPVYRYRQGKARYLGFEAELQAPLGEFMGVNWDLDAQADYVRARIDGFGPAPLIPPMRLIGTLSGRSGPLDGSIGLEHALRQSRTAPGETETPAYTLVNAALEWHVLDGAHQLTLGLAADNIFDVVARRHSSLLKDYALLAGRDVRLTLRFAY